MPRYIKINQVYFGHHVIDYAGPAAASISMVPSDLFQQQLIIDECHLSLDKLAAALFCNPLWPSGLIYSILRTYAWTPLANWKVQFSAG
ncbi:MAG: hypothetical protein GX599_00570 [Chloroflexi bacterium]|jgi:hypothetical protein|nr:hypothetical protein [Chloroflexota bacterium]NLI09104.1 hypothetical protein [Thermotogaceae bacterium]